MAKSDRTTRVYRDGEPTGSRQRRIYRRVSDRQSVIRAALAEHGQER